MSFGFSISDAIVLTQIALRTVQNSRNACGAHDALTHETSGLLLVLRRLKDETAKAESPINRPADSCQEELQSLVIGCKKTLTTLENILVKYNSLSEEQRSGRKLWQRIRFGNGEMQDLADLRGTLVYYTSAISLFLNVVSMGSVGRVEKQMNEAGGDLRDIRVAVNGITAHLLARNNRDGSVLTTYADDDKAVWKELRRELVKDGFSSSTVRQYKGLIKAYITELGSRGVLDEQDVSRLDEENAKYEPEPGGDPSSKSLVDATPSQEEVTESTHVKEQDRPDEELVRAAEDLTLQPASERKEEARETAPTSDNQKTDLASSDDQKINFSSSNDQETDLASSDAVLAQSVELDCGHRISHARLRQLFEVSVNDARYMPPRCCENGHIHPDQVGSLFDIRFKVMWNQKLQESLANSKNSDQMFEEVLGEGSYTLEHPCRIFFKDLIEYFRAKLLILVQDSTDKHVLCGRVFCARGCQEALAVPSDLHKDLFKVHALTTSAYLIFERMLQNRYQPPLAISNGIENIVRAVQTRQTVIHRSEIVDILFSINDWVLDFEANCVESFFKLQHWMDIASLEWSANNECKQMVEPRNTGRSTRPKRKSNPSHGLKNHPFNNLLAQIWVQNHDEDLITFIARFRAAQTILYDRYKCLTQILQFKLLEKYYHDVMLPRCEDFILNAPNCHMMRNQKYTALRAWVVEDYLWELNYVRLGGDGTLRRRVRERGQEARETLGRLDDVARKNNDTGEEPTV
ncbi:MAG: hypothetical protein Q9191_005682 [Dirinaria sp. TL-2023a]